MDMMQGRWNEGRSNNDPQRVQYHTTELDEQEGFFHDQSGEPWECWVQPCKELNFN
mgnify:CR=1 FL=1